MIVGQPTPASLATTLALAQSQAQDTAPAVLAEFPGTPALAMGQALFAAYAGIIEAAMGTALQACSYAADAIAATLQAIYHPGTPLNYWAGSYNTDTQGWGNFFSPLVIGSDGTLSVAGQTLIYTYDRVTKSLSWDWQTIKTTRATAHATSRSPARPRPSPAASIRDPRMGRSDSRAASLRPARPGRPH